MKRKLSFIVSFLVLLFLGSGCTYAPTQSWTPRHNKESISKKKPKTPKKKKKDKTLIVRMW
jgi:hypothetical protein